MSRNEFVISDTHFSHKGVVKFDGVHGTKLRPWTNVEEMNEVMVENWNKDVKPGDLVYHLGDVVFGSDMSILARLNGTKILIPGNHDQADMREYLKYFKKVRAYKKLGEYILSHVPVHPDSLYRWSKGNVHGHLHDGRVLLPDGSIDTRYICVCVEHTNYSPIPIEEIEKYR